MAEMDPARDPPPCVSVTVADRTLVKPVKSALEACRLLDRSCKVFTNANGHFVIPARDLSPSACHDLVARWPLVLIPPRLRPAPPAPAGTVLAAKARAWLESRHYAASAIDAIVAGLPRKYSLYPPMMLVSPPAFHTRGWDVIVADDAVRALLFAAFLPANTSHVAVNVPINEHDAWRRPTGLRPVHGDFGPQPTCLLTSSPTPLDFERAFWCSATQNGILQHWAPLYTMFLRGNIKEKARLLALCKDAAGKVVLDLYCGIGYFSLCYLKNKCSALLCWEVNPWSIQGFERALTAAKCPYRVFAPQDDFNHNVYQQCVDAGIVAMIFHESNENAPRRLASFPDACLDIAHVNLGLLPSSQPSWPIVRDGILPKARAPAPVVHVHENVHVKDIDGFARAAAAYYGPHSQLLHVERVKTFAPDVWHIVVDVQVRL